MYSKVLKPVIIAITENQSKLCSDELPKLDATSFVRQEKSSEMQVEEKGVEMEFTWKVGTKWPRRRYWYSKRR